jgi:hypothetical protein
MTSGIAPDVHRATQRLGRRRKLEVHASYRSLATLNAMFACAITGLRPWASGRADETARAKRSLCVLVGPRSITNAGGEVSVKQHNLEDCD